ncbi:hypothetical protein BN1182_CY_00500 [Pantoea ananatis]|nr:hypothetical protein BN1182_CY_00500 [Pantoea ananatis]
MNDFFERQKHRQLYIMLNNQARSQIFAPEIVDVLRRQRRIFPSIWLKHVNTATWISLRGESSFICFKAILSLLKTVVPNPPSCEEYF